MTVSHEAIAALPAAVGASADKAAIRALLTRRLAYALAASESATDLVAVDPDTGLIPLYLIQNNTIFQYDAADSVTAHDGVTCLVTSDNKRFKSATIDYPWSVLDKDTVAQPASPTVGQRYLVPTSATGVDWAGKDGKVAIYTAAGWRFVIVPLGRFLYVEDETAFYHRNPSGVWTAGVGSIALSAGTVSPVTLIGGGARVRWLVENQTTNTPPAVVNGKAYIVGPVPTGAWASKVGQIAHGENGAWAYYVPAAGWAGYDILLSKDIRYSGSAWVAAADALVLIETKLGSGVGTIDFTTGLDDTYDAFEIRISNLKPTNDDTAVYMRIGTGAGPTFQSSQYSWSLIGSTTTNGTGDSKIPLHDTTATRCVGNASGENFSAVITFNNPETSDIMSFSIGSHYVASAGDLRFYNGAGRYNNAGPITGIRFEMSGGAIAAGRFSLYGIRKS